MYCPDWEVGGARVEGSCSILSRALSNLFGSRAGQKRGGELEEKENMGQSMWRKEI